MIMADPYYRTIQGFLALLEIQWLGYGHQFPTRIGNSHAYRCMVLGIAEHYC